MRSSWLSGSPRVLSTLPCLTSLADADEGAVSASAVGLYFTGGVFIASQLHEPSLGKYHVAARGGDKQTDVRHYPGIIYVKSG